MYLSIIFSIFYFNLLLLRNFYYCFCLGTDILTDAENVIPPLLAIYSQTIVNRIQREKETSQDKARQILSDSISYLGQIKQDQAEMLDEIRCLQESNKNEIARSLELLQRFKPLQGRQQIPLQAEMLDEIEIIEYLKENNRHEITRSLNRSQRFKRLERRPQREQQKSLLSKPNVSLKGVHGGIFAGYGKQWGRFYLGLEATYLLSRDKVSLGRLAFRKRNTGEFAIRPGFALDHVLFYGRIGFLSSQFESSNRSLYLKGMSWGLGVDLKISLRILLGIGYACDMYGKNQFADSNGSSLTLKLKSHRMMLRFGYKM